MSEETVIKKRYYLKKTICCACGGFFSGNGFKEKYIIGQSPEGYIYAERKYCNRCGKKRLAYLEDSGKIYSYQFDE